MPTRLILVSDASRARLFREDLSVHDYELLESIEHAESRSRVRDLMADANGRKPAGTSMGAVQGSGNAISHSGRPGAAPDTDPKAVEAQKFARELADMLSSRLNAHEFDKLVLAAPPQFLGMLKSALSTEVSKHIEGTLHKDLTKLEGRELQEHISRNLS